jgi:DNA-binding winged helix-turn-helix (wHTH) protein/tetratricopeptide (TPR) repeat protein
MGVLRFDAFTLDQSRPALLRDGAVLELRQQSLAVLNHLVENAGRLVSKQELFQAVWGGAARTDDSLVQCVKDIRQALGDSDHRIVKTVHGRGYMFMGEVSEAAPAAETPQRANASAAQITPRQRPEWQRSLIVAGLLFITLAGSGWLGWQWTRPAEVTMMAVPSIAVLPVKALGDDTDTALATLADEIAAGIWRAPRGFVPDIKPTSAVKDLQVDPKAIGRLLGVRYVVRNLARREGEQLQITVQLIEADTARQVWAGDFDYRLGQPGAQGRTAARIGRSIATEVLRIEVRRPLPARPGAGHYTMLGRKLMTEESDSKANAEAIAYFEKAIEADPTHILALVHYARAVAVHSLNGWLAESAEAETLAKAERAINEALKRDTENTGGHTIHGNLLRARGEHEQAIVAFKRALAINQNFLPARAELGRALIDVGKYEEAIAELQKAIQASPTDISLYMWHYWSGLAAVHRGDAKGALEALRQSHQANRQHDNTLRLMAVALADDGDEEKARQKVQEFLKLRPTATLDDWKRPNARSNPAVAERREQIRATLKRLGVPESTVQAAARP